MVRWLGEQGLQAGAFAHRVRRRRDDAEAAPTRRRGAGRMKRFAQLFAELDASTATTRQGRRAAALLRRGARRADAAWAVYFLAGGKPRQVVPTAVLRALACERAGIADWLFEECYQAVGDLAETIAHVLPPPARAQRRRPGRLGRAAPAAAARRRRRRAGASASRAWWDELDAAGRFLLVKLIGGGFRVGVSKLLVQRALAAHAGLDAKLVAQRMMGYTDATRAARCGGASRGWSRRPTAGRSEAGQPYPFFLAHALDVRAGRVRRPARPAGRLAGRVEVRRHPRAGRARAPARSGSGRAARSW